MSQAVTKRVRKTKSVRRQEIAEAALRIMADEGFYGTSVARIAKAVGISNSTLYQHFRNREDVLLAAGDLLGERADEWITHTTGATAMERLENIGLGHLTWAESSLETFVRPLFSYVGAHEKASPQSRAPRTAMPHYELLVSIVKEGQQEGSIRSDVEPGDLAWAIMMFAWAEDMALLSKIDGVTEAGASHRNFKRLLATYATPKDYGMVTYIIRRVIIGIIVIFIMSLIVFFSVRLLPGDPALIYVSSQAGGQGVTEERLDEVRRENGLDKPIPVQYWNWVKGILTGDLGTSIMYHQDVGDLLLVRFQPTLILGFAALIVSTIVGTFLGLVAAIRRATWIDSLVTVVSYLGLVIPVFMLAFVLIYVFGLKLNWLPMVGWTPPWEDFWLSVKQSIMPVICLCAIPLAVTARQMRSSVLEVNNMDYVRTAWSKGLRERVIVMRHILKNSLIPVVTLIGISVGLIFGGAVIEESIFSIAGVGRLLVTSVLNRDYVVIQAGTLVIATIIVVVNIIVDISYGWLDPRIRYG